MRLLLALALLATTQLGDMVGFDRPIPDLVGRATYYCCEFHGRPTKSGEIYDQDALTVAVDITNWERYRGQSLLVCSDGQCVVVRVTDTGRFGHRGFALDLSRGAFRKLAPLEVGVIQMRAYVMGGEGNEKTAILAGVQCAAGEVRALGARIGSRQQASQSRGGEG